jgi:hypothetical protein
MYRQSFTIMETIIIVVGEPKFTTLSKVRAVQDKIWDISELNHYCTINKMTWMNIDDYFEMVNGISEEDYSIDLSNSFSQYCYVK